MKLLSKLVFTGIFFSMLLTSCGTLKKKKFLDFFSTSTFDSLTIASSDNPSVYMDPSAPFIVKGTPIDTSFMHVFSLEDAEDLQAYIPNEVEKGPIAYYKIKLNLGYYFILIRAAGEYWNSRYFGCLYHSGENKVTKTVLLAENFGEGGSVFICRSTIKKEENTWNIYTHQFFQEPVDFKKYQMDSLYTTHVYIQYATTMEDDRYFFKEINIEKTSNKK